MSQWRTLTTPEQLEAIDAESRKGNGVAIFKHSSRCFISSMARRRMEMHWDELPAGMPVYFLDLIRYREASQAVARHYQVQHQSPQLLLIRSGSCVFHASHEAVDPAALAEQV